MSSRQKSNSHDGEHFSVSISLFSFLAEYIYLILST